MKPFSIALTAAALVAAAAGAAPAQTSYECSGVGLDEREAAAATPHNLRIEYAQPDGHYLGAVSTAITDSRGAEVLSAECPGPWLLATLPAGSYRVKATFEGQTKSFGVSVPGSGRARQVVTF